MDSRCPAGSVAGVVLQPAIVRHINCLGAGRLVERKVPVERFNGRIILRQQDRVIADIEIAVLGRGHAAGVGQHQELPLVPGGKAVDPVAITPFQAKNGGRQSEQDN